MSGLIADDDWELALDLFRELEADRGPTFTRCVVRQHHFTVRDAVLLDLRYRGRLLEGLIEAAGPPRRDKVISDFVLSCNYLISLGF